MIAFSQPKTIPLRLPSLVAVGGFKRSGKGSISAYLCEQHGYSSVKFAGAIKGMISILLSQAFGMSKQTIERCIESDLKEVPIPVLAGKSTRYAMQILGTEWRSTVWNHMWTQIALRRINSTVLDGGRVVIDDLRFDHEVEFLRQQDAEFWLVERPNAGFADLTGVVPWNQLTSQSWRVGQNVLESMVRVLLSHSGLSGRDIERSMTGDLQNSPIEVLGGKSASHCMKTLREVWVPLMLRPMQPGPATTTQHASEKGLPKEVFDAQIVNDGSLADLHGRIDKLFEKTGPEHFSMASRTI